MKFSDILLTVLIIVIFGAMYFYSIMAIGMKNLEKKWPEYRCNPMVMPFASQFGHDPMTNFVFCIGNIQKGMMGFFLKPVIFVIHLASNLGGMLLESIQKIREMLLWIRTATSGLVADIFGVFINTLIQFQKMMIKIKDLAGKMIGMAFVTMHMVQGAVYTGQSIWRGPIGGIMRALCFKKTTPLTLSNGKKVTMQDIALGDILENGSIVCGKLQLKGDPTNPFYKIWSDKLNTHIYVTGSHKIYNEKLMKWHYTDVSNIENYIPVSKYKNAIQTNEYDEELSCLITSSHQIPVGEFTFWDWED
jgi:hypothetical protein